MKWIAQLFIVVLFFFSATLVSAEEEEEIFTLKEMELQKNVPIDKVWTIKLNRPVDVETVHIENILVTENSYGLETVYGFSDDRKEIYIYPPEGNYKKNTRYEIHVLPGVLDESGKKLNPVDMTFITGTKTTKEMEKPFIPNETNTLELNKNVVELNEIGASIKGYSDEYIIIENATEALKNAKVGDIFILPKTYEFPNGFSIKVKSKQLTGNTLRLNISKPTLEELLSEIDVKTTVSFADADVPQFATLPRYTASLNPPTNDYDIGIENGNLKIVFNHYRLNKHLVLTGSFMLEGSINVDINKFGREVYFKFNQASELDLDFAFSFMKDPDPKKKDWDGTISFREVKIPIMGAKKMIEVGIQPAVYFEGSGELSLETNLNISQHFSVEYDSTRKEKFELKNDKPTSTVTLGSIKAEATAEVGFDFPLSLLLFDHDLANVGVKVGIEPSLEGYMKGFVTYSKGEIDSVVKNPAYCLDLSINSFTKLYTGFGDKDSTTKLSIEGGFKFPLLTFNDCTIDYIKVPETLKVRAYEPINFRVFAYDFEGEEHFFTEEDKNIKMTTDSNKLYELNKKKQQFALKNVKVGDEIPVTVTHTNTLLKRTTSEKMNLVVIPNISGKVKDQKGNAIPNATVKVVSQSGSDIGTVYETIAVNEKGYYEVAAPGGTYKLVFEAKGYQSQELKLKSGSEQSNGDITLKEKEAEVLVISTKKSGVTFKSINTPATSKFKYLQLQHKTIKVAAANKQIQTQINYLKDDYDESVSNIGKSEALKELKFSHKVMLDNTDYVSLRMHYFIFWGGKAYTEHIRGVTMNVKTGKVMTLSDFAKTPEQKAYVMKKVGEAISKVTKLDYESYPYDEELPFYLNKDSITVVVPRLEYLAYGYSPIEVTIKFTEKNAPSYK